MKCEGFGREGAQPPPALILFCTKIAFDFQFAYCAGGGRGEKYRCKCKKPPSALRRSQ